MASNTRDHIRLPPSGTCTYPSQKALKSCIRHVGDPMPKRSPRPPRPNGHASSDWPRGQAPKRSARGVPATRIAALKVLPLDKPSLLAIVETLQKCDQVQAERLNPRGGARLRYRIELAAIMVANALVHARDAAAATGGSRSEIEALTLDAVVRRAFELDRHAARTGGQGRGRRS